MASPRIGMVMSGCRSDDSRASCIKLYPKRIGNFRSIWYYVIARRNLVNSRNRVEQNSRNRARGRQRGEVVTLLSSIQVPLVLSTFCEPGAMRVLATWKEAQCMQSMGGCHEGVTVGVECSVKAEVLPKGSSRESSPEERDCGPLTGCSWKGRCFAPVERPRHSSGERKHSKPLWEAGSLEQAKGKAAEREGTASSGRGRVTPQGPGKGILPGSWGALKGLSHMGCHGHKDSVRGGETTWS